MQGRMPNHTGNGFVLGQRGGESAHTLSISELPAHQHSANAINATATTSDPTGAFPAQPSAALGSVYADPKKLTAMSPQAIAATGGSQPHENMSPYLVLNFIIALQGIFPSQN
jgi:microcystin-dependent protein